MKFIKGLIIIMLMFGLSACQGDFDRTFVDGYWQITAKEANMIMSTKGGYAIVDARTQEEYDEGHIEGAIMIPEYEIEQKASQQLPDKEQLILVYCRSGRRSKIASKQLAMLGYTNVYEFGGIIDWPYDIVK